jgi:uncharacterized membrane protein/glutaredoxin
MFAQDRDLSNAMATTPAIPPCRQSVGASVSVRIMSPACAFMPSWCSVLGARAPSSLGRGAAVGRCVAPQGRRACDALLGPAAIPLRRPPSPARKKRQRSGHYPGLHVGWWGPAPKAGAGMRTTMMKGSSSSSVADPGEQKQQEGRNYRPTRRLLAGLATVGVLETAFLTAAKLFASPANICRTRGCVDVLSGPYATFVGIPLSLFGIAAYAAFAWLAAWPLAAREAVEVVVSDDGEVECRTAEEDYAVKDAATRPLLLALSSVLVVFSSYFMFLLTVVIRDTCPYCVFSAALSTSLFLITAFVSRAVREPLQALLIGGSSAVVSAVAAGAIFVLSSPGGLLAQMPSEPQAPPEITEQSDTRAMRIARKLNQRKTTMYGAYWCTHCYDQKQKLGKKAFAKITYIECDRGGVASQAKLCRQKRIPGYPTWEIDGELYPGELQMEDLEKLANGEPLGTDDSN